MTENHNLSGGNQVQCPNCATESANDHKFCTHCGFRLAPPRIEATEAPPIPDAQPKPRVLSIGVILRILAALLWAAFIVTIQYRSHFTNEAVGYWFGLLLVPILVSYAIAGAKERRNWSHFSYWFLGLVSCMSTLSLFAHHQKLYDLPGPDMLKVMMGAKPLDKDADEDDQQTVAMTKQIFADMRDLNNSYTQRQAVLEPDLDRLYTASSFSNRQSVEQILNVVNQKLALDQETSRKIEQMPQMVNARLEKSGLSEADRRDFIQGFESKFSNSSIMASRKAMIVAETDWTSATIDLYKFALDHLSQIVVTKTSIGIADAPIRTAFNAKFTQARKLRDDFNASTQKLAQTRAEIMKSEGVTTADMGLTK